MEHYIKKIEMKKLLHLSDLTIELAADKRTNLLLTGKNGSGKTTVLRALKKCLKEMAESGDSGDDYLEKIVYLGRENDLFIEIERKKIEEVHYETIQRMAHYVEYLTDLRRGFHVEYKNELSMKEMFQAGKLILAYYSADRKIRIVRQTNVENVVLENYYSVDSNPGSILLKYLVHLKTQQAYAKNENNMETVEMIEQWFARLLGALKILLDDQSVELQYDYKNYNFNIITKGRQPFGFDQLSDGYSAVLQIVADLMLRMERNWLQNGQLSSYDAEGIVLIDELETHLHIGLQKTILPFLTEFFPKIQFIVSTHSPYILNSIENCVIYDLENQIRMEDMSGYSVDGIVEGYFEQELYSDILMKKIKRYTELVQILEPDEDERAERAKLRSELKRLSGDLSKEAKNAFEEIEEKRKEYDKI